MKSLSNYDFDKYFQGNRYYAGTFCKNELPKHMESKFYIINMDNSTDPRNGTHWMMLYNVLPDHIIYVDPFGAFPPNEVLKFMHRSKKIMMYSLRDIQNTKSNLCGWICLYVANELLNGYDITTILKRFSSNTVNNEKLIRNYFNKK
jgi:hypothetical protein